MCWAASGVPVKSSHMECPSLDHPDFACMTGTQSLAHSNRFGTLSKQTCISATASKQHCDALLSCLPDSGDLDKLLGSRLKPVRPAAEARQSEEATASPMAALRGQLRKVKLEEGREAASPVSRASKDVLGTSAGLSPSQVIQQDTQRLPYTLRACIIQTACGLGILQR